MPHRQRQPSVNGAIHLPCLPEDCDPRLSLWIIRNLHQYTNTPHAIRLLRAGSERPGRRPPPRSVMNSRLLV
jgi:hypothetical protein